MGVFRGNLYRAIEVREVRPPAAMHFEMLPVDLNVGIDRGGPDVGVLAAYDHAAAVASQVHRLRYGIRGAGRLDHDIGASSSGQPLHLCDPFLMREIEFDRVRRPHPLGKGETGRRSSDHDHRVRASDGRQRGRRLADRARAQHDD
jgi:hypothetical protein